MAPGLFECSSCGRDDFKRAQDVASHLRWKKTHPDADHPADQLPMAGLSQPDSIDYEALVARLAPAVARAIAPTSPAAAAAADSIPNLDVVVAHCEGGSCPAHTEQLTRLKTRIVEAAFEAMPDDIVKKKAAALGMVERPRDIRIETMAGRP